MVQPVRRYILSYCSLYSSYTEEVTVTLYILTNYIYVYMNTFVALIRFTMFFGLVVL